MSLLPRRVETPCVAFGNPGQSSGILSAAALHMARSYEQQRKQKPDLQSSSALQGEDGTNKNKASIKNKTDMFIYTHARG